MVRPLLSLVLAVTTLAGPWLCCCTAAQVANWFRSTEAPVEEAPAACCCCCCATAETPTVVADSLTCSTPTPVRTCTCLADRPVPADPRSAAALADELPVCYLAYFDLRPAAPTFAAGPAPEWPVWNAATRDLTHTHHVLRC